MGSNIAEKEARKAKEGKEMRYIPIIIGDSDDSNLDKFFDVMNSELINFDYGAYNIPYAPGKGEDSSFWCWRPL